MGSTSGRTNEGLGRRDLIKRSAALGLIAVPTMSFLSACASSDGGSDEKVEKGTKSAKNPLGVNETAALEVVIFNGGFGEQYAIDAEKKYNEAFPKAPKVKHAATEKIQSIAPAALQRRHPAGPDRQLGRRADGHGCPGRQEAARRPDAADGRPVVRRPGEEGPRHPAPRCPGDGPVRRRPGLDHVLRVHGLRRLVLADQPREARRGRTRRPGTTCSRSAPRRRRRASPAGRTRASTRTTCRSRSTPSSPRSAAARSSTRSTTWSPNAWKDPAVKAAFEAYYELFKKGYILKGTPGLTTSSRRPSGPRARRCSSRTVRGWRTRPRPPRPRTSR